VFRDDTIATAVGSFFLLVFINTTGEHHSTACVRTLQRGMLALHDGCRSRECVGCAVGMLTSGPHPSLYVM
jgi:hypothetical protein